jgi:perosamine synthetase
VQLQRLDELLKGREQVAHRYNEQLADLEMIARPTIVSTTTRMSWFVYVIRVLAPAKRDVVMAELAAQGIPSRPYFTPIHLQPFYRNQFGYQPGSFLVTEELGETSLALPFSSTMSETQVGMVCESLRRIVQSM